MKKTLFVLLTLAVIFMALPAHADPVKMFGKTAKLDAYLNLADSGNTTAASGVSTVYLDAVNDDQITRSDGTQVFDANEYGPWYGVQLLDLDSSIAQQALGGTISKDFDFYAECSLDDDDWANAERFYFYKNETVTATTNNTAGPRWRRLPANTYVRFGFVTGSGTTVFDHAQFRIYPGKEGGFYQSTPVLETTAYPGNVNSGVSSHTVSEGVRWLSIGYGGDAVFSLSIDGDTVDGTDDGVNMGKAYLNEKVWEPQAGEVLYWNCEGEVTPFVTEAF